MHAFLKTFCLKLQAFKPYISHFKPPRKNTFDRTLSLCYGGRGQELMFLRKIGEF
jgi:hypothetical protein